MDGGEQKCGAQGSSAPTEEPLSGLKLADAPILFLVYFHKAFKAELDELRRTALELSESVSGCPRDLVLDFCHKFEFLKLVYKYHSAAEDEVIFLAFDALMKNVVCTYMHEHKSIDSMFESISDCLTVLLEQDGCTINQFQELVFHIGTIRTAICQHMLKEEKQVFPLLVQQFSSKDQASLIWQFLCSAPIMLLQDLLPWLTSFFSPDEHKEILHCIKEVVPEEGLVQEVVIIWLHKKNPSSSVSSSEIEKTAQIPHLLASSEDTVHASESIHGEKQFSMKTSPQETLSHILFDGLLHWNGVIREDFKDILKSLLQIRRSKDFSTVDSVIVQLKFLADVLIFYSAALDNVLNSITPETGNTSLSQIQERFLGERKIEGLQRLLYQKAENGEPVMNFVENLTRELELFMTGINVYLLLLESEVFPFIVKNYTLKFQQWLQYTSLRIMPLGLLKCIITWFSAHLSERECKSILSGLKEEGLLDKHCSLKLLLHEWIRMGYSGKTSIDKCKKDLQEMYLSRNSFLTKHVREDYASISLLLNIQHWNSSSNEALQPQLVVEAKEFMSNFSSCDGSNMKKWITSYSSGLNKHIFPHKKPNIFPSSPKVNAENSNAGSIFDLERRPVDLLFYFHKALKKDLEYLVIASAKLVENVGDLEGFRRQFQLVRFQYQIHSDSEDEIAFPALEAKGKASNISQSYAIDHKLEVELFNKISFLLDEISVLHASVFGINMDLPDQLILNSRKLCLKLHDMCKSLHKVLCDHAYREEIELWPLFREYFTVEEQEKIIGSMLGRMNAEILQDMIPWLLSSLTLEEQQALMSLWLKATKNTMFHEWLGEWWEETKRHDIAKVEEESNIVPSWTEEPLKFLSTYLSNKSFDDRDQMEREKYDDFPQNNFAGSEADLSGNLTLNDNEKVRSESTDNQQISDSSDHSSEVDKKKCHESAEFSAKVDKPSQHAQFSQNQDFRRQEHLPTMSQEELETAIRKISRDSTLDSKKKSYMIQSLLTSRWIVSQQNSHSEVPVLSNKEEVPGQSPSYHDPLKLTLGCEHYKRNCKLVAACCGRLYTCRLCHDDDDVNNHVMDRKATVNMMCMKCLRIQPVGPTCSTSTCHNLSMAKYYCSICKFFDDERDIYHCPYCNICRLGKGLGIDYFHCMHCNACMNRSLSVHICIEKSLEDNCPICHEYIFSSRSPVKSLSCGHLMHSSCFQDYTFTHYTCPICSKSLGDMQVYFAMLDALLAEEKIPDEYSGQTQRILCNDCEKRGTAPFHWLYRKCPHCGSYNTRLL